MAYLCSPIGVSMPVLVTSSIDSNSSGGIETEPSLLLASSRYFCASSVSEERGGLTIASLEPCEFFFESVEPGGIVLSLMFDGLDQSLYGCCVCSHGDS